MFKNNFGTVKSWKIILKSETLKGKGDRVKIAIIFVIIFKLVHKI